MRKQAAGFTLAELLISLAILGVIATFTIPKIIGASGNGQNTAIAKEAASMIAGAMSTYQLNNSVSSGTTAGALTPFMNYVSTDTSTVINGTSCAAGSGVVCLRLHNGGFLEYNSGNSFGSGSAPAVTFNIDPDGIGTATAATFIQYQTGRLTTGGQAGTVSSTTSLTTISTDPAYIQSWN